jgi:hypothetical protein
MSEEKGEFDHIVAAGHHARALHVNADGSPLTEHQHAAILHAMVKAIIDGKFEPPVPPEPAPVQEPAPAPEAAS